ncbi:MAG TPA: adenosine deaminase, partial [Chloroflexota bacterium]|nr:adenosine deaminase [Chloroflexota bacterium]
MRVYQSTSVPAELAERLRAMPKVEIHVHLEGAVDAETIWEMSVRNSVPMPVNTLEEWRGFYEFRDFPHFAHVYTTAARCIRTPEDYSAMVVSFLRHQADQNIRYSEAY